MSKSNRKGESLGTPFTGGWVGPVLTSIIPNGIGPLLFGVQC